jgi:DNA-directed RNA polymerase III subunit RPC8
VVAVPFRHFLRSSRWCHRRVAMFELAKLHDTVHIQPSEFAKPILSAVTDALSEKYPNKVVPGLGLCVTLHDILHVGESQLYPGSAAHHTAVEFRVVVFRPHVGEVMTGTVVSCDPDGVRVSLGFFDEIHVPARMLQPPSTWSAEEGVWIWDVTPDHQLFLDLENELRFRIEEVRFREPTNAASLTARREAASPSKGVQSASGVSRPGSSQKTTSLPPPPPPPPPPPAMQIIAGIDRSGLGLTSWWPPDDV